MSEESARVRRIQDAWLRHTEELNRIKADFLRREAEKTLRPTSEPRYQTGTDNEAKERSRANGVPQTSPDNYWIKAKSRTFVQPSPQEKLTSAARQREAWSERSSSNTGQKTDLVEMLLLQTAQIQQAMMQQILMTSPLLDSTPTRLQPSPHTTGSIASQPQTLKGQSPHLQKTQLPPIYSSPLVTTPQYSPVISRSPGRYPASESSNTHGTSFRYPERHHYGNPSARHWTQPKRESQYDCSDKSRSDPSPFNKNPSQVNDELATSRLMSKIGSSKPGTAAGYALSLGNRNKVRRAFLAIAFISRLRRASSSTGSLDEWEPNKYLMFELRIKEVFRAIQRIFIDPDKRIMKLLQQVVQSETLDLTEVLSQTIPEKRKNMLYEDISLLMENIIFELTEIMPDTGVLGTHRKSGIFKMLQSLDFYPPGYFYRIEMDLLEESVRTGTITYDAKIIILSGIFLGRALVILFLLRPVESKLMTKQPSEMTSRNLKFLATLFVYILRILYRQPGSESPAVLPPEVDKFIYSDSVMEESFRRLKKTFDYCENLMRNWCKEYVKRIDNAATD